tara:strand:+ start:231 stop:1118 length:888 start_codon:yes stop_codon:yes gene_type:complete
MLLQNKFNKIIIGTANMGSLGYGYRNKRVLNPKNLINYILKKKFFLFDTAYSYNSEKNFFNLNKKIKIYSKTIQINKSLKKLGKEKLKKKIFQSINKSIINTPKKKIFCMYIHRIEDFFYDKKIILNLLKKNKKINHIGISLDHYRNLKKILSNPEIKYIQLPINIFDQRWKKILKYERLIQDKRIVARSIFLQGLIFKKKNLWPKTIRKFYPEIKNILEKIKSHFPKRSIDEICYTYVNSINKFDKIIIGVSKKKDIEKIIQYQSKKKFSKNEINLIEKETKDIPKDFYIPSSW